MGEQPPDLLMLLPLSPASLFWKPISHPLVVIDVVLWVDCGRAVSLVRGEQVSLLVIAYPLAWLQQLLHTLRHLQFI